MADTSTIKSLDELIIKEISAIRESEKHPHENRIYDSIKILFENCDMMIVHFGKEWSTLKKKKIICNKPTKKRKSFLYFEKRSRNYFLSNW